MPVIKVFSAASITSDQVETVGADLERLCLDVLRAQPTAIQIVFVPAVMARGAPALLEMHYRAQPYRDADALTSFMDGAEASLLKHLGQTARIRCFSVDVVGLSARN
ncbi:hypothetical protein [Ottowia thiooxydans]|uniref:hypothetical protein n=1 Tax=Ottowia thiooxydans TaxID=219182 RepID=UPI0012EB7A42|nr:hypothetical protein [Ottowia thiooxydans]